MRIKSNVTIDIVEFVRGLNVNELKRLICEANDMLYVLDTEDFDDDKIIKIYEKHGLIKATKIYRECSGKGLTTSYEYVKKLVKSQTVQNEGLD